MANKVDLKHCYHQYPVNLKSRNALSFEFLGKMYSFAVLPYGPSPCPFMVQAANSVPADVVRFRYDLDRGVI